MSFTWGIRWAILVSGVTFSWPLALVWSLFDTWLRVISWTGGILSVVGFLVSARLALLEKDRVIAALEAQRGLDHATIATLSATGRDLHRTVSDLSRFATVFPDGERLFKESRFAQAWSRVVEGRLKTVRSQLHDRLSWRGSGDRLSEEEFRGLFREAAVHIAAALDITLPTGLYHAPAEVQLTYVAGIVGQRSYHELEDWGTDVLVEVERSGQHQRRILNGDVVLGRRT